MFYDKGEEIMIKREAIQAMLDGSKVRKRGYNPSDFLWMSDLGEILDQNNEMWDINYDSSLNWELYEEPSNKVKATIIKYYAWSCPKCNEYITLNTDAKIKAYKRKCNNCGVLMEVDL